MDPRGELPEAERDRLVDIWKAEWVAERRRGGSRYDCSRRARAVVEAAPK